MSRSSLFLVLAVWQVALAVGAAPSTTAPTPPTPPTANAERVDFNFQIRPLLSDRCFACHGPDDQARKATLSLHTRDGALRGGKSGTPSLTPGNPAASEILRRITTTDVDDVMPPPDSKLPALTPAEVELVRRWIAEGAEFKEHWAFLPVSNPVIPALPADPSPPGAEPPHPIDAFVRTRLTREGLSPQPEAPRETLLRRLSLDLTGLPPSLAELDAFLQDTSPQAYERAVDRLLGSPHYGEWMAVEWMDLARYADTFGYQADVDIDLSPWRDWVIRAFNENLPWNQFITWQLAGDLLEKPTPDQVLATAFNRLHRQTNEGGSIDEEWRIEYVSDRVHTMGTAFLGLTLECSRCHDHKYDPISQRDYYSLSAFFNSIDESGLYSHFTRATPTPVMPLWQGDAETRHARAAQAVGDAEVQLAATLVSAGQRQESWARGLDPAAAAEALHPTRSSIARPVAHFAFDEIHGGKTPDSLSTNTATLQDAPRLVPADGGQGQALQFSGDNSATITHAGTFGRTDPFSFSLRIQPTEAQSRAVVLHASRAWSDSGSRGYELVLDEGRPTFALIHFWPGNAVAVRAKNPLALGQWADLAVTYDGSSRAAGIRIFLNGHPLATEVLRDNLYKDIQHRSEWGDSEAGNIHLTLGARFRDNGFRNGVIDDLRVFDTELTEVEIVLLAAAKPGGDRGPIHPPASLLAHYLARHDEPYRTALAALRAARVEENNQITPVREMMVMKDLPEQRTAYVLKRGMYDARAEAVGPGVPERIMPFDPALPRDRLGLARWIVDPRNPLAARVAVNRVWKLHFGRGLAATTWDLGAQGQMPTHPELLDWLARRFVDSDWNRKSLHKLIVTSATYRQASTTPAALGARDPDNQLLARGPRHRLSAEQIRDSALAVSGLLVPTLGGPSVKPYQPAGVWEEAGTGKSYTQDKGDKLHRRSLYTFWRRTAPPPGMLTFDATSREVCTAKRETTATPLQSLMLLNDVQFLEAARVLAERLVVQYPAQPEARITEAFRRITGRQPETREQELLQQLHEEQLAYFASTPGAATNYLAAGEHPHPPNLPAPEVAATTVLTSTLMNHDEFVTKR